jgi:chemotaxis protein CheZ
MPQTRRETYDNILDHLRVKDSSDPSLGDVVALARIASESMQQFIDSMDAAVNRELRGIADYIVTMKQEIGVFQANDIKDSRIPAAGQELDAVVQSTEEATNSIMECAEEILAADTTDPDAYQALVTDKVMQIFEACSFQDLTGQRVSKVVETLQTIENRVGRLIDAVNAKDVEGVLSMADKKRHDRKEALMLNGPQLEGGGNDQNSVDEMFK